jgi:ankyrin repeat protein
VKELHSRLSTEPEPQRIGILLSLAYCKSLGYIADGEEARNYSLEAARLGSANGKHHALVMSEAKLESLDLRPAERLQWMLDVLLVQMPQVIEFCSRISEAVPDLGLRGKVLTKVFESECLRSREILRKEVRTDGQEASISRAFDAAKAGNSSTLKLLLKENPHSLLNVKVQGFTLLHVAAEYGKPEVIRVLLNEFDVGIDSLTSSGVPSSVLALRAHDLDTLAALLSLGAEYKRLLGAQTLRYLANYGGPRALRQISYFTKLSNDMPKRDEGFPLKLYLDGGFSVYPEEVPEDEPDFPPIFAAILGDNLRALWSLLELGCSTGLTTEFSSGFLAPLHLAANLYPLHLAVLLHYGADPNQRTADGNLWTALHLACVARSIPHYLYSRVSVSSLLPDKDRLLGLQPEDYIDVRLFMAQILVQGYGADVNAQDWVGRTALSHCMSDKAALPVADCLVGTLGANIHIKDFRHLSCLHRAVLDQSSAEHVEFCVAKGINVDERDLHGMTPLMMAVVVDNVQLGQKLIDLGADLLARQKEGWASLHIAVKKESDDTADLLFTAVEKLGLLPIIIDCRDIYQQTLLHKVVYRDQVFFEKYIGFFPLQVTQRLLHEHDVVGFTLLHHAVLAQNPSAVRYFLEYGADANAKGWHGMSPLHVACGKREDATMKLLEESGGNLNACDEEGMAPSDYSARLESEPGFWKRLEAQCVREGDNLAGKSDGLDVDAVEQENRARARAEGGW